MGAESSGAHVPVKEKVGYALGDTASNFYWKTFENYLVYFYTDVFGISAAVVGTMLLITRIWDAVNDPIIGYLADRTKTAWGRFRPYLLWMAIPFGITGVLTFYTPDLDENGKVIYAYITYSLVMMAYTAINIPYGALMGVISPSSIERTSVSTFRFVGAFIGGIIVQALTLKLVVLFGGSETVIKEGKEVVQAANPQSGFFWTMVVYSIAAVILFIITFATTKERVQPDRDQKTSFWRDTSDLLSNGPWLVLFAFGLFNLTSIFIRGAAIPFYFKYYVQSDFGFESLTGAFLVTGSLVAIGGMLLAKPATRLFGKRNLMIGMTLINAVVMASFFFLKPDQVGLMFGLHVIGSFVNGPSPVLLWAMYADVADYSEWKNGRRATGLVFSAATFSQKLGCAVGAAMSGWVLAWYGYEADTDLSESTLKGISMMMSLIPAGVAVVAAISVLFYSINEKLMATIETDLEKRKANKTEES